MKKKAAKWNKNKRIRTGEIITHIQIYQVIIYQLSIAHHLYVDYVSVDLFMDLSMEGAEKRMEYLN